MMTKLEIRWVDALPGDNGEGDWTYNETRYVGEITVKDDAASGDIKQAILASLPEYIRASDNVGDLEIVDDWDYFEVVDRKTREPKYIAMFKE